MRQKNLIVLVGGSDLFSGMRGISKGTRIIRKALTTNDNEIIALNYNYFLDSGRSLKKLHKQIIKKEDCGKIIFYGYSKGGDVVLQLARLVQQTHLVDLLITIDVANGPWSHKIDRHVPGNVCRNVNVYQTKPNFPLCSHGLPAHSTENVTIENVDITNQQFTDSPVIHRNIENFMVSEVIGWIKKEA